MRANKSNGAADGAELCYETIAFAKFSILLLDCSLFPGKRFALYARIIGAAVLAWATACIFGVMSSCLLELPYVNESLCNGRNVNMLGS